MTAPCELAVHRLQRAQTFVAKAAWSADGSLKRWAQAQIVNGASAYALVKVPAAPADATYAGLWHAELGRTATLCAKASLLSLSHLNLPNH